MKSGWIHSDCCCCCCSIGKRSFRRHSFTVSNPHKQSGKRSRPGHYHSDLEAIPFAAMSQAPAATSPPVSTLRCAKISARERTSWLLVGTTLFLAIQIVAGSHSSTVASGKSRPQRTDAVTIDHLSRHVRIGSGESKSIWDAIDEKERLLPPLSSSSSHRSSEVRQPEEGYPPTLRGRSIRATERNRKDDNSIEPSETAEQHRLLIRCDPDQTQDECRSTFLARYDTNAGGRHGSAENDSLDRGKVRVVHNLESISALAVEVDAPTLARVERDGEFRFWEDSKREPLMVEGSMKYHNPSETGADSGRRRAQQQDSSQELPWGLDAIGAQAVWKEHGVKGEGVMICVLDTGIQASHEDFRQSYLDGYYGNEFVSSHWYEDAAGHGTHITGTMVASNNTVGIVGIAPEAEAFVVRVFDNQREFYGFAGGTTYSTDLIAAASICKDRGAHVINASLGGSQYNAVEEAFFQSLLYEHGIVMIAAAGNRGTSENMYPAAYDGVLSVGASDRDFRKARFSNWNSETTDVLAPGVDILSTFRGNEYATFSGTSMAVPHATGALALMMSYVLKTGTTASTEDLVHAIKHTAAAAGGGERSNDAADDSSFIGVIDADAAIRYLASDRGAVESRLSLLSHSESNDVEDDCLHPLILTVATDSKAQETEYRLTRLSDNYDLWNAPPNTLENFARYTEWACLEASDHCYRLVVRDGGGNGISEGGYLEITFDGNELYRGGTFGSGGVLDFCA